MKSVNARFVPNQVWADCPNGLCRLDRNGTILDANPSALSMMNNGSSNVFHAPLPISSIVHPSDGKKLLEQIEKVCSGKKGATTEARIKSSKEGWKKIAWTLTWDTDSDCAFCLWHPVAYGTDEPSRTDRLESQLRHAQRIECIGTLAGGVAHDLNNVLAPIMMALEMLRGKEENPEKQNLISMLHKNCERGSAIIRQMLTFARGVEGAPIVFQLRHLIKETVSMAKKVFPKQITIKPRIAGPLWTIQADPAQIHQVCLNLLLVARDSMSAGGTLEIMVENLQLSEGKSFLNMGIGPGDYIHVEVKHSGNGWSKEEMEARFSTYLGGHSGGMDSSLGLASCIGIVEKSGGLIEMDDSKTGDGTIHLYLPRFELDSRHETALHPPNPAGHGELILVVDDEMVVRKVLCKILIDHGYRVEEAENGAEAVALFADRPNEFDLVITDMIMPQLDGRALITAIRAIQPQIKIIGTSGYFKDGRSGASEKTLQDLGVETILEKPFTAESLLAAVGDEI